jgi:hypothetical protein
MSGIRDRAATKCRGQRGGDNAHHEGSAREGECVVLA